MQPTARHNCRALLGILGTVLPCADLRGRRSHEKVKLPARAPIQMRTSQIADVSIRIWPVLLRQDLANVESGIYPLPADHDGSLLTLLHRSRLFFQDLPEIHRRRERGEHSEVLNAHAGKRPRYYLQNFHFQSVAG
jgi:hypothetical protein